MDNFFLSLADKLHLETVLDLLGADDQAFVLVDDDLRISALTESARFMLGAQVLRPIAEHLSAEVADALHTCVRERSHAELGETIDDAPYRLHVRAFEHGLLVHIEPAYDIYRSALVEFETRRIRSALSSILIATQKLRAAHSSKETMQFGEMIRKQSLSIQRVLLHADALTAPPASTTPDLAEGDLAVLCREIATRAKALCGTVAFKMEIPRACPAIFDMRMITQAICNLITNAVKAPDVSVITLRLSRADEDILISVADNGRGFPSSILPRLYDGWRTLQNFGRVLADEAEGVSWGLGLPLTHRIAEAHGGMLLWNRGKENGCIFTICLPDKHDMPPCLMQAPLRIQDGFDLAEIELSILK